MRLRLLPAVIFVAALMMTVRLNGIVEGMTPVAEDSSGLAIRPIQAQTRSSLPA